MKKFKKVYTLGQIEKDPRVEYISDERMYEDGLWIYLKAPYVNRHMETTCIHEDNVADLMWQMNGEVVEWQESLGFPNPYVN